MCTVLLPPGVNPIAVNKYIKYQIKKECGRTKSTAAEENTLGHKLQPTNIISYSISRLRSRIFEILE